jgi:hypothetical protein
MTLLESSPCFPVRTPNGGKDYLIALNSKGQVISWNNYLKVPEMKVQYTNEDIISIQARQDAIFALTSKGELYRWGGNFEGLLGIKKHNNKIDGLADNLTIKAPKKLELPDKVKEFVLGDTAALALLQSGAVWGWGGEGYDYEGYAQIIAKDHYPREIIKGNVNHIFVGNDAGAYADNAVVYMNNGNINLWETPISSTLVGTPQGDLTPNNTYKNIKTMKKIIVKNGVVVGTE